MKNICTLLLMLILFSCNSGETQIDTSNKLDELSEYPEYRIIARRLLEKHKQNPNFRFSYEIAKKPEGWVLVITDWTNDSPAKIVEEIFWSSESKSFKKLESDYFKERQDILSEEEFEYFMKQNYNREFYSKILPYTGYLEYYNDLVNLLEGYDKMNDTLYHALGLGYFGKTQFYLGYKTDYAFNYNDSFKPEDYDKYIDCAEKCIEAYKKGIKINPEFKSFVGNLRTKMSNDIVGIWYEMELRGYGEKAKKLLDEVNYPQMLIDFALNTLNSCDSNAILFTHGDNDTYPLWFVQNKMNIRKDISVVNTSLLGAPFYPITWKSLYSIPLKLSDNLIKSELSSVVMLNPGITDWQDMNEIFESMTDEKLSSKMNQKIANSDDYLKYGSKWSMELEKEINQNNSLKENLVFNFNKSYIYRSDLLIMNIIHNNQWKRPIYFAETFATSVYSYLERYLVNEGLVLSLRPTILYKNGNKPCSDTLKQKENLLNNYVFSKCSGSDIEERMVNIMLGIYYYRTDEIYVKNKATAIQLLDKAFLEFPDVLTNDKFLHLNLALLYHEVGQSEKAKKIIQPILSKLKLEDMNLDQINKYTKFSERLYAMGFESEGKMLQAMIVDSRRK